MDDQNNQAVENIIRLMESVDLKPKKQDTGDVILAKCPRDRTHGIKAHSLTNTWTCKSCGINGGLLELKYYTCLSELESLNKSINMEVDELNSFLGTSLTVKGIRQDTLLQFHSNLIKKRLQGVIDKKELFQETFRILDQYRLSMMLKSLNEGREPNDDIRKWWANRY